MSTETNPSTPKKPRAPKSDARKAHVLTDIDGKEWLVTLRDQRVAGQKDLNKALDGDLPRGAIVERAK